jgi:hypothetical protein
MTKKLLSISIVLASLICFSSSQAQTLQQTNELILSVPAANSKNYSEIIQKLISIQGVDVLAYCEQTSLFLIKYNTKLIDSGDIIARQVEDLNIKYKAEIKTGTSISQLIDNCTRLLQPAISTPK